MMRVISAALVALVVVSIMIVRIAWDCFVLGTNWIDRKMDDVFSHWV